MEAYISTMFEVVKHKRSRIILISVTDHDIIKQSRFTDHEMKIIKHHGLEKFYRQKCLE